MTQHGKIISIQDVDVVLLDFDYGESKENETAIPYFNIRFDLELHQRRYSLTYNKPVGSDDHFSISGDDYEPLLKALETAPALTAQQQYSLETEQALHEALLPIAESVYEDVEFHSPDQDEE
ncbi:hypothetical protein SAMN05192560_1240 [Methylobacillus rhizosphaerae]|uniref:Uncharacterized protein n=1 Tax=Methylobacillus rhizosphaerae TaxID=551994 RepID=A0A238ZF84_9PROT|nr:hypothetical protein [Methylobacillus rhizosphaerae]SNR81393.1 hypothetical protein SAMN05192560_1240 [Methylobacillus rhizosphaerae]